MHIYDDCEIPMNWEKIKNRYRWIFNKEDVLMKALIATSGLFIGLLVGKGLQVLFSSAS